MSISGWMFVFAGIFLFLDWLVVPKLQRRYEAAVGTEKIALAVKRSVLEVLRTSSLLFALGCLLTLGAIKGLDFFTGGESSLEIDSALEMLRVVREKFSDYNNWSGYLATASIVGALIYLSRRQTRATVQSALEKSISEARAQVRQDRENGLWEDLPPNEEMIHLDGKMTEVQPHLAYCREAQIAGVTALEDGTHLESHIGDLELYLQQLSEARDALDERRRLKINWHPDSLSEPEALTPGQRLRRFFVSKGLIDSLEGFSKLAFIILMVLMIPSIASVASGPISTHVGERIVHLDDLRLSLREKDAKETWQKNTAGHLAEKPQAELDSEDEEALDQLAQVYDQIAAVDTATTARITRTATVATRQLAARYQARQAILQNFAAAAEEGAAKAQVSAADALEPGEKALLKSMPASAEAPSPLTAEGRAFRTKLRSEVALQQPSQWKHFKTMLRESAGSFQQLATQAEMEQKLFQQVFSQGIGGVEAMPENLREVLGSAELPPMEARARAQATRSNEFLAALRDASSLEQSVVTVNKKWSENPAFTAAERAAMQNAASQMPEASALERQMRASPPSLSRLPEVGIDAREAESIGSRIASQAYRGAVPDSALEALSGFDGYFPGHEGDDAKTARARAISAAGRASATSSATQSAFGRARSFTGLRGFARIGGVLIGDLPESTGTPVNFVDLRWRREGSLITLEFVHADGTVVTLPPMRASVLHYALAYAADGRPVTVTMTPADPLAELKIHLHPALLDSAVGCHAVELDRYVDTLSSLDPLLERARNEQVKQVMADLQLYRLTWALFAQVALEKKPRALEEIGDWQDYLRNGVEDVEKSELKSADMYSLALRNPKYLSDPIRSPLKAKPEFFDGSVADIMAVCAEQARGSLPAYRDCASSKAAATVVSNNMAWSAPAPEFEIWSGVREGSYQLDANLDFARLHKANGDLWPFDFILQTAFTSPPYGLAEKGLWWKADKSPTVAAYVDKNPWQFPALQPQITQGMRKAVSSKRQWAQTVGTMQEFAVAQRLFRVVLEGELGEGFPLARLEKLQAELLASKRPSQRTPRFNPKPGAIEIRFLELIAATAGKTQSAPDAEAYLIQAAKCLDRFKAIQPLALSKVPFDEWDKSCRFTGANQALNDEAPESEQIVQSLIRRSVEVSEGRRLRKALGVERDEVFSRSDAACKSLM